MDKQNELPLEQQYPSVELAFPLAIVSYDVAIKRLDTMDGRLQTIMAFVVTVSAAIPSIAGPRGVRFQSIWFYIATAIFIITIAIGTYARLMGTIKVLKPKMLFEHWLHKPAWEFKKDFISFAGDDFEHNVGLVEHKWKCTVAITLLFFFQTVCLAVWVAGNRS